MKRSVQLSIGSFLSRQRLVEPLVLGGEVGEGGVELLNCGHNILRGDSRARTKHLERKKKDKVGQTGLYKGSPAGVAPSARSVFYSSASGPQTD